MTVPDVDPYPTELPKIRHAFQQLEARFKHAKFDDATMQQFHQAAVDLFADAGFIIGLAWDELHIDGRYAGVMVPTVMIQGRITPETEHDHDRISWEVRGGLADGQRGVIRPDGTKTEEPARKNIY